MPAIAIIAALLAAGGIIFFALKRRGEMISAAGSSMPDGMGNPLVAVSVVPVWAGPTTENPAYRGGAGLRVGSKRPVLYSEIARHFSSIRIDGERVIVGKVSRGVGYEGNPIIRQAYDRSGVKSEVWEVATVGGGSAGMALDAIIIVGGAAATAFGGPAAGAGVAAAGAAIRSQVR